MVPFALAEKAGSDIGVFIFAVKWKGFPAILKLNGCIAISVRSALPPGFFIIACTLI